MPYEGSYFILNSLYMVAPQIIRSVLQGGHVKNVSYNLQNRANNYNKKLIITIRLNKNNT